MNNNQNIPTVRENLWKGLNSWGQILQEQCTCWQNIKLYHTKQDMEQFALNLNVIGKMIDSQMNRY